jgi:hypothetical protein
MDRIEKIKLRIKEISLELVHEGYLDGYVIEGYKKEYLEWMNPKSAQQKFEKWSKEQAEIQERVNDNENRETVTDNTTTQTFRHLFSFLQQTSLQMSCQVRLIVI